MIDSKPANPRTVQLLREMCATQQPAKFNGGRLFDFDDPKACVPSSPAVLRPRI